MKIKKQTDPSPFTNESLGDYIYNTIIKDVNDLKSQVIDIVSQNKHTVLKKPQVFLNKVNDFLKFWYEYGKRAAEAINTNGVLPNPTTNLKYNYVRKFLFGNFDFKSVLLYVDGMIKNISDSNKKYTQDDLENFYKFTIKDAFGTDNIDVSSLLTDFEVSGELEVPDEEPDFDINMLQGYDIFKDNDYTDLYKSIEGIIDFISFDRMKNLFLLKKEIKNNLLSSFAVKSIFDYMIFSLTFYAIRIYTVAKFLNNFVNDNSEKNDSFTEAVITPADSLDDFLKKMIIFRLDIESAYWYDDAIFASMNELIARDLDKTSFYKMFKMFADAHDISNMKTETIQRKDFISEFTKYFSDSKLFNFFIENDFKDPNFKPNLTELYLKMKYLLNVPNQALVTSKNPVHNHKTQFLDAFIRMSCSAKDSVADIKHSAVMVYHFTKFMFEEILSAGLNWINNCHCREIKPSDFTTDKKIYSILNNFLSGFYDEFSLIVLKVMQFLENKMYYCEDKDKDSDSTSKPSPGYVRSVTRFDQIFIDGQSTFNESSDLINVWSYPYYENMKIYKDYLQSYPEFRELSYFKEAGNDWWDKIVSWFTGLGTKISSFFTNKKVQTCITWVDNNKSKIQNATWKDDTEISVEWYYYKANLKIKHISDTIELLGEDPENAKFNDGDKFSEDQAHAWENELYKNFLSTYPNDKPEMKQENMYELGTKHAAALKAAIVNRVFYNTSVSSDSEIPMDATKIKNISDTDFESELIKARKSKIKSNALIKKCVTCALSNLNSQTFNTAEKIVKDSIKTLKDKISAIKSKIVSESVEMYLQEQQDPNTGQTEFNFGDSSKKEDNTTKPTNDKKEPEVPKDTPEKTAAQKNEDSTKSKSEKLPYVQNAYNRILMNYLMPVELEFPKFFLNQYNFVKAAYEQRSNKES